MKFKTIKKLTTLIIITILLTGCFNNDLEHGGNKNMKTTELEIFGATIEFNMKEQSNFWEKNYGHYAAEIDALYAYSLDGEEKEVDEYGAIIVFHTSELVPSNESDVNAKLNRWYGITNPSIKKLDKGSFLYNITGESATTYYETNYLEYDDNFGDSSNSTVYYQIDLVIRKNQIDSNIIQSLKDEYHLIIDTLKFK